MAAESFFSRWSRRKSDAERAQAPEPEDQAVGEPQGVATDQPTEGQAAEPQAAVTNAAPAQVTPAPMQGQDTNAPPQPTLDDVARLTHESDYSRFVASGVDEDVKRAAMKKLFSDPHFNKMDGLDIYIDDYTQSTPIPQAMLRKMVQAQFLGLFREEEQQPGEDQAHTGAGPDGGEGAGVTASYAHEDIGVANEATPVDPRDDDEDPDLQLQPDDAPRRPGPGEGPGR